VLERGLGEVLARVQGQLGAAAGEQPRCLVGERLVAVQVGPLDPAEQEVDRSAPQQLDVVGAEVGRLLHEQGHHLRVEPVRGRDGVGQSLFQVAPRHRHHDHPLVAQRPPLVRVGGDVVAGGDGVIAPPVGEDRDPGQVVLRRPQHEVGLDSAQLDLRLQRPLPGGVGERDRQGVPPRSGGLLQGGAQAGQPVGEQLPEALLQVGFGVRRGGFYLGDRPAHGRRGAGVGVSGGKEVTQVPLGGRPGHLVDLTGRGERQQAAVAGQPSLVAALAGRHPAPGPVQQVPHAFRAGQLGQVAGAAGHDVVQQQRLDRRAGVIAGHRDGDRGYGDVVGQAPDLFLQAQRDGRGEAGQREPVAERHRQRQPQHGALGGQGSGQREVAGVLGVAAAVPAPRLVFGPAVGAGVPIELAAALAQPEQRRRPTHAGELPGGAVGAAGVDPPHVQAGEVLHPEGVPVDVPLLADPGGIDVGGQEDREPFLPALVGAVVDLGLVAVQLGRHAGEFDHVQPVFYPADPRIPAPRTRHRRRGCGGQVGGVPAGGAERHRPDRGFPDAQVDGVDRDLQAAGVERGAGRELPKRVRRGPPQARALVLPLLGVGVDPGQGHLEGDAVVDQGVVGQQSELLQHPDPVLPAQVGELLAGDLQRSPRRAERALVLIAGGGQSGHLLQFRQGVLDRLLAVAQALDRGVPALRGGEHLTGQRAAARPVGRARPRRKAGDRRLGEAGETAEEASHMVRGP